MLRRAATGTLLVMLILSALTVLQPAVTMSVTAAEEPTPLTTPEGFTNAEFEIRVFENGSARWHFRVSRPLANETEIDRFEEFEQRFESTETAAFRDFKSDASDLVALGTNVTNRSMNATGFDREARIRELGGTRGVVEFSFVWTNLARTDGERVLVGDVFEGGFFVGSGQRLVISRGPNLRFQSVDPPPDSKEVEGDLSASGTVTWFGERSFSDKRPRAVFVPEERVGGNGGTSTATPSPEPSATPTESQRGTQTATDTPETARSGDLGMLPVAIVFVVLLGLGGGIAWYSGGMPRVYSDRRGGTETESSPGGATESSETPAQPTVPDEELLSDEDRVVQLLEDNGGRMKQVHIVDETDWSKSKVSMLLSDMEDDGQISKLRVGRENIVSLAGEEPDAAGSPFEDE